MTTTTADLVTMPASRTRLALMAYALARMGIVSATVSALTPPPTRQTAVYVAFHARIMRHVTEDSAQS
jgi:hypothetical protein